MKSILFENDIHYVEIFRVKRTEEGEKRVNIYLLKPAWGLNNDKIWEDELTLIHH